MPMLVISCAPLIVIAGLDPAIHRAVTRLDRPEDWMPGSNPGMTVSGYFGVMKD